jgi:hypothetical protein
MVNSGSWYVRVPWPHDGRPYESDRFVVYSDSASSEARRELADQAERLWTEILSEMDIEGESLSLPPGQDKVDIYAFKDRSPEWAGKAYYGGLVISSPDRRILFGLARTEAGRYESTLKHELVHVVSESLLHARGLDEPPWVPVWFFEGFAEVMSTGTGADAVRGKDHLNYLTSKYGHLNPVSYESDANIEGGPAAYTQYHYPMRQLAVEYLLNQDGIGKTPRDATALLIDMAGGTQYETAFADHMGITVTDYENQFFELMTGYLPERSGPIIFTPIGLLVISMITIGVASLLSVRSLRTSPHLATLEGPIEHGQSTRFGQIGFVAWVSTVVALSLGLYLIGVSSIGGSFALTSAEKGVGLAILVGYLSVSAFVLTLAIRLRRNQSPIAWLCPLIPIGAAAATTAIIIVVTPVL